ncbi:MAG: TIGR03067 domain-containing protein [Planctomycetota bacterium]|nr:TIGR03067 domain-containing protein [Planctomycetota bacterium]
MAAPRFSQKSLAHLMRTGLIASAATLLSFAAAAADANDHEAMAGTWRVISLDANGTLNDSEDVRKITVVNKPNGDWTLLVDGNTIARGTSSIDEATNPKTVDLTTTETTDGNNVGRTYEGIYDLGEKTRRVCLAMDGGERPTQFFSAAASGHVVVTYEKVE